MDYVVTFIRNGRLSQELVYSPSAVDAAEAVLRQNSNVKIFDVCQNRPGSTPRISPLMQEAFATAA